MIHDVEFDLFQARSAKLISESLGAQLNPDLSWTSSFNTPSSLTPTVILRMYEYSLGVNHLWFIIKNINHNVEFLHIISTLLMHSYNLITFY